MRAHTNQQSAISGTVQPDSWQPCCASLFFFEAIFGRILRHYIIPLLCPHWGPKWISVSMRSTHTDNRHSSFDSPVMCFDSSCLHCRCDRDVSVRDGAKPRLLERSKGQNITHSFTNTGSLQKSLLSGDSPVVSVQNPLFSALCTKSPVDLQVNNTLQICEQPTTAGTAGKMSWDQLAKR